VEFVAAETLLHRYLQSNPTDKAEIAEAYYLLAVAEANASHSYWISETSFLLENAIRNAPQSSFARQSYAFLEQFTLDGYAGSTLPEHVQANLNELRTMIGD
jgi:hypothetical protein